MSFESNAEPGEAATRNSFSPRNSFTAAIPDPFRILGVRLLPLSLGRYRLLRRFDCAFVSETDTAARVEDLLIGIIICSMRCDEFLELFETDDFFRQIRRWGKSIAGRPPFIIRFIPAAARSWRRTHSFNLFEKMQLFRRYIEEGSVIPHYFNESNGSMNSGAHWSHAVEVTLRSELNWNVEEIEEAPLTKALSDYFKHAENNGMIRLMTEEDARQGELNAGVYAQFLAANPEQN
jgi:hypothetical protein